MVMRAPSGQRFCIVRVQRDGFDGDADKLGLDNSSLLLEHSQERMHEA